MKNGTVGILSLTTFPRISSYFVSGQVASPGRSFHVALAKTLSTVGDRLNKNHFFPLPFEPWVTVTHHRVPASQTALLTWFLE